MVYPITPILLTRVLGAPAWTVGLIEGIAESTASLLKLYSGWLSDRYGRRKPFVMAGYGLAAVSKPLIALASNWGHVLGARFLDRTGKGLRTAPRDALIAENCAPDQRGRAFGLHRSMDTMGAVLGPLAGWLFLQRYPDHFRGLYLLAFVPAVVGVLVLALVVKERRVNDRPSTNDDRPSTNEQRPTPNAQRLDSPTDSPSSPPSLPHSHTSTLPPSQTPIRWAHLSAGYKRYLAIVALFGIGNSSDAFLLLRARDMGVAAEQILLLYAVFNIVEASLGYAAGRLSDRIGRHVLIAAGWLVFAFVYLGFAMMHGTGAVWLLFILYGFYYTLTQGVQKALATDLVHPERRGTEIGLFHMLVGIAALPASLFAGLLYNFVSPAAPFLVGAATACAAAVLLLLNRPKPISATS
jgi:MFS family permease